MLFAYPLSLTGQSYNYVGHVTFGLVRIYHGYATQIVYDLKFVGPLEFKLVASMAGQKKPRRSISIIKKEASVASRNHSETKFTLGPQIIG